MHHVGEPSNSTTLQYPMQLYYAFTFERKCYSPDSQSHFLSPVASYGCSFGLVGYVQWHSIASYSLPKPCWWLLQAILSLGVQEIVVGFESPLPLSWRWREGRGDLWFTLPRDIQWLSPMAFYLSENLIWQNGWFLPSSASYSAVSSRVVLLLSHGSSQCGGRGTHLPTQHDMTITH